MAQKNKPKQGKRAPAYSADSLVVCLIVGLLLIALGVLIFLATAVGMNGDVFLGLRQVSRGLTGALAIALPIIPIWGGVLMIWATQRKPAVRPYVLFCVIYVLACAAATLLTFVGTKSLMDYIAAVNISQGRGTGMDAYLLRSYEYGGAKSVGGGLTGMLLAFPMWLGLKSTGLCAALVILAAVVTFLFLIKLDVKGIAARLQQKQNDRRAQQMQQQHAYSQQELAWQQDQVRIRQAQPNVPQQMAPQYQPPQQQYQPPMPPPQQPDWSSMMPAGTANWNDQYEQPVQPPVQQGPIVKQVETGRSRKAQPAKKPQIGFAPPPEVNDPYVAPQPIPEAEPDGKKKRGGLFRREEEPEVALPRRKGGLFDRLSNREEADDEPLTQPVRRRAVQEKMDIPQMEDADVPEYSYVEEEPIFPSEQEQPAQKPAATAYIPDTPAPADSFLGRLQQAKAAAGMPAPEPAPRKSRKDVPSGWSETKQEPSWREETDPRPVARSKGFTKPAAIANADPKKQRPKSSWEDTPPWEDDIEQPATVVTPVTQKKPEGAWEPDLKLQPKRTSAAEQMAKPMFDEPAEVPYVFPTMDLLKAPEPQAGISEEEDALRSRRLENTLQSFRVPAKVRHITHGPAISRFELELAAGIKVSKVTDLNRNIAMNMEVKSVRIEAPIPGKPLVGVEVPNKVRATVTLREVLESEPMRKATKPLVVALGKDIAGTPIVCDLAKMPHLLIAGATGSGKSVCINTIINSLLYRCSPKEVRLILVDPKVVELQCYNGIPHLLIPVVSDPHKASGALAWAVGEMMDRYKRFQEAGVRAIDGYNENVPPDGEKMPRIVIVIDELADLMMTCKKDVEERICRLAQLARAAGIHLIVATQRPSVDVITGLIKANIPSRIAFKVSSNVDSRTILDRIGAEQLLGYGDMLYMPTGEFAPTRVQGCFLSDAEVNRITDFIRESCPSDYDPAILEELEKLQSDSDGGSMPDLSANTDDDYTAGDGSLLAQCIEMAVNDGQVSTSLIQRRLKLGYARAGRIVDEMEKRGIITAKDGAKPRMCLISREEFEQMKASGVLDVM